MDSISTTASGIMNACGRELLNSSLTFIAFYIIGIPLGVLLALLMKMGVFGLTLGLLCGTTFKCITVVGFIYFNPEDFFCGV